MSEQHGAHRYVVGVFETVVIVGKVHERNLARAEELMQRRQGPDGETLEEFSSGTAEEVLAAMPELITREILARAEHAYSINPQHQIQFDRPEDGS